MKKRRIDKEWFSLISELFVNLAAGWFGAILIIPNFSNLNSFLDVQTLIYDFVSGILSLVVAYLFKKLSKRGKYD